MRAASFRKAAGDFADAVGTGISHTAVWRITTETGQALCTHLAQEAAQASVPAQLGGGAKQQRVAEVQPIEDQANISSDGVMVLVRHEGWKEVKIAACSRVRVLPPKGTAPGEEPSRRDRSFLEQ